MPQLLGGLPFAVFVSRKRWVTLLAHFSFWQLAHPSFAEKLSTLRFSVACPILAGLVIEKVGAPSPPCASPSVCNDSSEFQ